MKIKSLVPKKLKYKPITAKTSKYNLIDVKPIFDNTQDWDKDGVINRKDCMPLDPNKHGLLSSYWKRHKALKEAKDMSKLGYTPTEDVQDDIDQRLSESETGIQHFKEQVADKTEQYGENIKEGFKDTDRNFNRMAKDYTRRTERAPGVQQHSGGRAVHYLIPSSIACRKMYADPDTGEPISVPKFKRDKYVAFSPGTVGKEGPFVPKNAPLPRYLIMRKLGRLINYYRETGQVEKLRELQEQLRGGE